MCDNSQVPFVLFCLCFETAYNVSLPTNTLIILIHIFNLIWLLHVPAVPHPQAAHDQTVLYFTATHTTFKCVAS